jgi:hypothetical protein
MVLPVGSIIAYAGNVDGNIRNDLLAQGWLLCDGSAINRNEYTQLFEALEKGRIYGRGDGANTFNLPDLRGYFMRGVNDPDMAGGRPGGKDPEQDKRRYVVTGEAYAGAGSIQDPGTARPSNAFKLTPHDGHRHALPGGDITADGQWNYDAVHVGMNPHMAQNTGLAGEHSHEVSSSGDRETRPINIAVNYLIRVKP